MPDKVTGWKLVNSFNLITMKSKKMKLLSFKKALAALSRRDARMLITHAASGDEYFIVPGGPISAEVAGQIAFRTSLVPLNDGLFPGHTQSWKMA